MISVECPPTKHCGEWNGNWPGRSLTGLPKDSVANVSLIVAVDKGQLTERCGKLPRGQLDAVLNGIDAILGC